MATLNPSGSEVSSSPMDHLPDEIIQHILYYVAPEETINSISQLSRRFHRITEEPLLWKYYCRITFRYWNGEHQFKTKLLLPVHHVDWKGLFLLRLKRNDQIATLLDAIIASRIGRLNKVQQICRYAYDAKEYLIAQYRVNESVEDAMARRYYAGMVLDSIHRGLAIDEWAKCQQHVASTSQTSLSPSERLRNGMSLERALGAFDMFLLHDAEGDLDEITELLDDYTMQFRNSCSNLKRMTTRQKALALVQWLHLQNLTGIANATTYRYLRNCLIGRALRDEQHPSIPIISSAIFCSIASRIGLEAHGCQLPSHVFTIVLSEQGQTLDGTPLDDSSFQEKMFLDPFESDQEMSLDYMHDFLAANGAGAAMYRERLLVPAATTHIVMRTAHNIRATFDTFRTLERPWHHMSPLMELGQGDTVRNLQPALYSIIWASIMMIPAAPENTEVRWDWHEDLRDLLKYFAEYFPEDAWIVEKHISPVYDRFASRRINGQLDFPPRHVHDQLRVIRITDTTQLPTRRRVGAAADEAGTDTGSTFAKYKIGQVFKHKRYDNFGIIVGWTYGGKSDWLDAPPVSGAASVQPEDSISDHQQTFYRTLVGSYGLECHLIAEENIQPVNLQGCAIAELPDEIRDLMHVAGRYFKRWDPEFGRFVSNIKELYPDD